MPVLSAPVQLTPSLHLVYAEFPHVDSGNVYLLAGQFPTLIDCGSQRAVPRLVRNLEQAGVPVTSLVQVIATHGDFDHTQGYHDLLRMHPGLKLRIHRNDWPGVLQSDPYRTSSYVYGRPFVPFAMESCLPVEEGDVLAAGNGQLTVLHTPGHTEGSICLYGEADGRRVLFAGDAYGGAMKSLDGADLQLWAQAMLSWQDSLRRLAELPFEWVLNGHEPATSLPLPRADFDRRVKHFGKMMNPWFFLAEDDVIPEPLPGT